MKPFKVLNEEVVFEIPGRYSVTVSELETPEGKQVKWSVINDKDVSVVLALDSDNQVYLKKEWRLNRKDFSWELVSGIIEPGEDPLVAAERETQEEVGMKPGKVEHLLTMYASNHAMGKRHLYLATDLVPNKLAGDEHEILEVERVPFAEAYKRIMVDEQPTAQSAMLLLLVKQKLGLYE